MTCGKVLLPFLSSNYYVTNNPFYLLCLINHDKDIVNFITSICYTHFILYILNICMHCILQTVFSLFKKSACSCYFARFVYPLLSRDRSEQNIPKTVIRARSWLVVILLCISKKNHFKIPLNASQFLA